MLSSDRVLRQQYRAKNYQFYSQLIHTLTQAEKHDELLLKNYHKHHVGSAHLPEVHNVQKHNRNKRKSNGPDPKDRTGKRKHNRDKEEILIRGTKTMRSPKMTISVIDVGILRILPGIAVHQSIWLLCTKSH
jgi:hypothetical protein